MDNKKTDLYFLEKIISDLEFICRHTKVSDKEELEKNEVLIDSILFRLIQVSENSDRLTELFMIL